MDLHGQHEHQSLLHAERHVRILDEMGDYGDLLATYAGLYERTAEVRAELATLRAREAELRDRRDLLRFQVGEIDTVAPAPGEDEQLEQERRRLDAAEELYATTASLYNALYEGDGAILGALSEAARDLERLVRIDDAFSEQLRELGSARIAVEEVAGSILAYHGNIEFNPERLEEIRERLGELDRLARKYGGSLEAVLDRRMSLGSELDLAEGFDQEIARLEEILTARRLELSAAAWSLSAGRSRTASSLVARAATELADLGMPDARLQVNISQEESETGWIQAADQAQPGAEGTRWRAWASGVDRVSFQFSANAGESLRPLARVASGGEVSRVMLALKSALSESSDVPVLVFDEIDSASRVQLRTGSVKTGCSLVGAAVARDHPSTAGRSAGGASL